MGLLDDLNAKLSCAFAQNEATKLTDSESVCQLRESNAEKVTTRKKQPSVNISDAGPINSKYNLFTLTRVKQSDKHDTGMLMS